MDEELERYHKSNASLDLTISDLKLKQDGLKTEVLSQRFALGTKEGGIQHLQHDLHDVVQSLQVCTLFAVPVLGGGLLLAHATMFLLAFPCGYHWSLLTWWLSPEPVNSRGQLVAPKWRSLVPSFPG